MYQAKEKRDNVDDRVPGFNREFFYKQVADAR